MDRQQQQQWGPSLHKVSWAELCKRESSKDPNNAKTITGDGRLPIFMSSQLQSQMGTCNFREKDVLLKLRPVDALHIPHLRVDDAGKKIITLIFDILLVYQINNTSIFYYLSRYCC